MPTRLISRSNTMLIAALLCFLGLLSCYVAEGTVIRGLHPGREKYYNPESDFTCLDGSDTIPFSLINDDYCDCMDGSDEPGTSACPNMRFHCPNKGHSPMDVYSSRVNDKICDCCDGSDEWGTDVTCPNTCQEMGRQALVEQQRLRDLNQEGYKKRLEYSKQGREKAEESRSSLAEKEAELESIKSEIEALEAAKEAVEEPEKEAKDSHQKKWEEEMAVRKLDTARADAQFGFEELDANHDGYVTVDELRMRYELDDNNDGDISEEEALEYLNNNLSVDFETFYSSSWEMIADKCQFQHPTPPPAPPPALDPPSVSPVDESSDYDDEEDEDDDDDDDDYDEEEEDESEVVPGDGDDQMPDYDDATKELIAAADEARSAHGEAEKRKTNIEREIAELRKYLEISYGANEEFSALYGQCYEFTDREYTYRMCGFGKVTQKPKNGGRETNLGSWGKWNGPAHNVHSVMRYEDGEKCWNGPSRSATISLVCGLEDRLLSASEPNRCEYAMEFSTPAVCEFAKHAIHEEL